MAKPRNSFAAGRLERELAALDAKAQLRGLAALHGINFCSNDYLGLSGDARLRKAVVDALSSGAPVCSTGSRLLSGNSQLWEELESDFARFMRAEAALYFNSGYAANAGLFSCIAGPEDVIFSDAANHASIIDGIRLSGARKVIFPHLDLTFLEQALQKAGVPASKPGQKFVAVESVFSMDGARPPILDLAGLCERYGAELIVDEAHATGVFGPEGRGCVAAAGVTGRVLATIHTCGKALAGVGAFVSGPEILKTYLINSARTFIFSTALPPYMAAQIRAAIQIVAGADADRRHLADLSAYLRGRLQRSGFDTGASDSQIVPVLLGSNERAVKFAAQLSEAGFAIRAIRPPTVPEGTSRLRLSLHVGVSLEMLDRLVNELVRIRERTAPALCAARP